MKTKTTEQLKSIAYNLIITREKTSLQFNQINQEIAKRDIDEQKKQVKKEKSDKE
jgi:hypothetical protein